MLRSLLIEPKMTLRSFSGFIFVDAVVQFSTWLKSYFPLFCGVVVYDNKFEAKENKI